MVKMGKFSKKYGLFLSDASNEEIVSVSKELMNSMTQEVRSVTNTALALLAASLVSSILMITLISGMTDSLVGTSKSVVFLTRITAIALLCVAAAIAGRIVFRMSDASSISSVFWRNIRETANDERAYEQTQTVKAVSTLLSASKNHIMIATLAIVFAVLMLGSGFIYELLVTASYI